MENGRPDLAGKVRQMLDILKNTEQDEEICELIQMILRMKTMPNEVIEANPATAAALRNAGIKNKTTAAEFDAVGTASSSDGRKERKMAKRSQQKQDEDDEGLNNNKWDDKTQLKNKKNAQLLQGEGDDDEEGMQTKLKKKKKGSRVQINDDLLTTTTTMTTTTSYQETLSNKSSFSRAVTAAHDISGGDSVGQGQTGGDPSSIFTTEDLAEKNKRLKLATNLSSSLPSGGADQATSPSILNGEAKMIDQWSYLNSSVILGEDASRRRRGNRRVSSRSSSRALEMRMSMERDLSEEDAADIPEDDDPVVTIVPPVITSAKDISRDVIDVLRYSCDKAKKELYTQKILEAVGLGASDDSDDSASSSKPPIHHHLRKGSACIILKDFLQTIVPSNAAHGVLVGDVDYMIVDDEGVRYFESASGFASRRNSRFDIRQSQSQRASSERETTGPLPNPWADVGPRSWADVGPRPSGALSSSGPGSRRMSIDEFRKRLVVHDQEAGSSNYHTPSRSRDRSRERPPPHGRHSTTSVPISRSNSGYITPLSRGPSRRSSLVDTELSLQIAAAAAAATMGRKRSVLMQQTSSDQLLPPISSSRRSASRSSFDSIY